MRESKYNIETSTGTYYGGKTTTNIPAAISLASKTGMLKIEDLFDNGEINVVYLRWDTVNRISYTEQAATPAQSRIITELSERIRYLKFMCDYYPTFFAYIVVGNKEAKPQNEDVHEEFYSIARPSLSLAEYPTYVAKLEEVSNLKSMLENENLI